MKPIIDEEETNGEIEKNDDDSKNMFINIIRTVQNIEEAVVNMDFDNKSILYELNNLSNDVINLVERIIQPKMNEVVQNFKEAIKSMNISKEISNTSNYQDLISLRKTIIENCDKNFKKTLMSIEQLNFASNLKTFQEKISKNISEAISRIKNEPDLLSLKKEIIENCDENFEKTCMSIEKLNLFSHFQIFQEKVSKNINEVDKIILKEILDSKSEIIKHTDNISASIMSLIKNDNEHSKLQALETTVTEYCSKIIDCSAKLDKNYHLMKKLQSSLSSQNFQKTIIEQGEKIDLVLNFLKNQSCKCSSESSKLIIHHIISDRDSLLAQDKKKLDSEENSNSIKAIFTRYLNILK